MAVIVYSLVTTTRPCLHCQKIAGLKHWALPFTPVNVRHANKSASRPVSEELGMQPHLLEKFSAKLFRLGNIWLDLVKFGKN